MAEDESFFLRNFKHELERLEPWEIKDELVIPAVERIIRELEDDETFERMEEGILEGMFPLKDLPGSQRSST
jgi:hypothetical protein